MGNENGHQLVDLTKDQLIDIIKALKWENFEKGTKIERLSELLDNAHRRLEKVMIDEHA